MKARNRKQIKIVKKVYLIFHLLFLIFINPILAIQISQNFAEARLELLSLVIKKGDTEWDLILNHGCWCSKLNPILEWEKTGGAAVDKLDEICKSWFQSRHCNDQLVEGSCYSLKQQRNSDFMNFLTYQFDQKIGCANNLIRSCQSDSCLIDQFYLLKILKYVRNDRTFIDQVMNQKNIRWSSNLCKASKKLSVNLKTSIGRESQESPSETMMCTGIAPLHSICPKTDICKDQTKTTHFLGNCNRDPYINDQSMAIGTQGFQMIPFHTGFGSSIQLGTSKPNCSPYETIEFYKPAGLGVWRSFGFQHNEAWSGKRLEISFSFMWVGMEKRPAKTFNAGLRTPNRVESINIGRHESSHNHNDRPEILLKNTEINENQQKQNKIQKLNSSFQNNQVLHNDWFDQEGCHNSWCQATYKVNMPFGFIVPIYITFDSSVEEIRLQINGFRVTVI